MKQKPHIVIIGGGAAGFFCAINAAQKAAQLSKDISLLESSSQYLKKVRISGGGRCNVTHNQFDVREFTQNYPRGSRELLSPMQQFQAKDTIDWFQKQGVKIVAEADRQMFPDTDRSETIINTYLKLVEKYKIRLAPSSPVKSITPKDNHFIIKVKNADDILAHKVLVATGSSATGYPLAESLGHKITERAPSLFSFKIKDPLIEDLQGLSFTTSLKLSLPNKKKFKQQGPTLITHWGLSGPAILKLSAWAAREMKQAHYKAQITVNWVSGQPKSEFERLMTDHKQQHSKSLIKNGPPQDLPKRFWHSLLKKYAIDFDKQWANLSKKEFHQIVECLTASQFEIHGQNRFKDEFVECGGVSLKEIDFKSMQSKKCPGLYFAGEIFNVDGITGGFNFQNAWTTAWVAAQHMVEEF